MIFYLKHDSKLEEQKISLDKSFNAMYLFSMISRHLNKIHNMAARPPEENK